PFGETLSAPTDEIGYTGHKFDADLGLSYMQARYYDPVIGRFYSNDPVGPLGHLENGNIQGFNRYAYANNNPYKYTDPTGEVPAIPIAIAAARACASNAACRGAVVKVTKNLADKARKAKQRERRNERRQRNSRDNNDPNKQNQTGTNKERFEGKQNAKKQSSGKKEKSDSRQGSDTKTQRGRNNQKRDDGKKTNATEKQAGNRGSRDPDDKF
ncbi:RHS repeat-associated core domain-containing protein, partial [Exilibacterium tricleocarpae]